MNDVPPNEVNLTDSNHLTPLEIETLKQESRLTIQAFRERRVEEKQRALLRTTTTFCQLAARHPNVVLWPDYAAWRDGFAYYWVLSETEGESADFLLYLRVQGVFVEQQIGGNWVTAG